MSLEPSSSGDATASRDSVDHSAEDSNLAVNAMLNKKPESGSYKYDDEVFTKYKDWDLTQTKNNASNDNVNDGEDNENPTALPNDQAKKEEDGPKIIGDIPDSWSVVMSIKRALWPIDDISQHMMLNNGRDFDNTNKKAKQIVLLMEKTLDKKNALLALLNETKDCQGTIIYVRENKQANFIAAYLSELHYISVSIQSDHEISKQKKALEDFKNKKVKILVAVAASLVKDLQEFKMVINFDLPDTKEEYLQRIGCVGESDIPDKVFSFFDHKCDSIIAFHLIDILKDAGQNIPPFLPYYCIDEKQPVNTTTDEVMNEATNPTNPN